ncbi:class I SAM-dependent methyltransferase [Polynucleobacter sp. JS-Fieb-80-E5]|uniref:class I SAM-dependent methyltransferase n=1 Tax=Polynucleobacter sp. JS-Fieb-80-E5 TaxID=2081050 RepID=UPI001C0B71F9|nr:class I SAM-dependent methyltransferase [Polynucleobacter sp. JS-Fieb-80-E5]MBU3618789.1 class I SAM-dependent methyltransferase [Polynucleobacter sp. JS-Fieb-80-E5]
MKLKSLDLGCGGHIRNPFNAEELYGVDISIEGTVKGCEIRKSDLAVEPIPYDSLSFDVVTAYDLIEHIPRVLYLPERRSPFIFLMNEISRVLKPGGVFFSQTPAYPHAAAFQDPTHVNFITDETFREYFCINGKNRAINYGYRGSLYLEDQGWRKGMHIVAIMTKKNNG